MFGDACQPEIIRSNQKDDYYISHIKGSVADIVQHFLGPHTWIRWRKELDLLADICYFGLTTFAGFQTLGEEYVTIVQTDQSKRAIPTRWRRMFMILLQVVAPYVLDRLLSKLEQTLQQDQTLQPQAHAALLDSIPALRHAITVVHRCHLALFYLRGIFYHLAKRITGIHYIRARKIGIEDVGLSYRILGWLSTAQLAVLFIQQFYKYYQHHASGKSLAATTNVVKEISERPTSEEADGIVDPSRKCALCLEARRHSTATPCGHLFCWTCISEWALNKTECPLCRETFEMSRLICLQNYDPL